MIQVLIFGSWATNFARKAFEKFAQKNVIQICFKKVLNYWVLKSWFKIIRIQWFGKYGTLASGYGALHQTIILCLFLELFAHTYLSNKIFSLV